jgi:HD-GYP domain-containing protein (c-di-GMP phosphodiesterase class II)
MKRDQVPVEKLEFGMYVAELDRPWTDTPFMYQGFQLRTPVQLAALKKFCKHVFVDPARTEPPEKVKLAATAASFKVRGNATYPEKARVEDEFKVAQPIFEQTAKKIDDLLTPMSKPGAAASAVLDAKEVKESVTRLTDSVVRNPDAMLLVSRLREKSEAAHARALQVSLYMIVFARFLQLERQELEKLGLLGLLQDIGKTRLPPQILEKKGPLTPAESEIAKEHVMHSAEILKVTPGIPPDLPKLVLLHHERQDGSGYPNGLKGDEIGLYGSMAAIADSFDALTAVRPYADPMSPSAALSLIYKERGTGYHAELVEQFIQCVGAFPVGSVVELNSGEVGIVITQNLVRRLKPRVMVVLDAKGAPVRPHKILDLDRDPKVTPDEPYKIRRTMEQTKVVLDPREFFM